jgi:endonuclease/exonuclease/phosphatase family metal-dependent hydrolase
MAIMATVPVVAKAAWDPHDGEWTKSHAGDVRVMTWNVRDHLCSSNPKQLDVNSWSALVLIVSALQPDVLIVQEAGDNTGCGTGSGVDSVSELETVADLFFHGGVDPFLGGDVTAYVESFAPGCSLPYTFASSVTDGYNRNLILSRFPFADLNGDTRSQLSDIPLITSDEYAPGGTGGIRGFQFAELDLPDTEYEGDLVVGNAHLKAYSDASSLLQRLNAAKNVAYFLDYWYNGAGTGVPDPHGRIRDNPPATDILDAMTPVVIGGDWNEDEATNGRDGPALWLVRAEHEESTEDDGTDRDRSDGIYDAAANPITGSTSTYSSSKLDYLAWQDSIATIRRAFVFNSAGLTSDQMPAVIRDNFGRFPEMASGMASDHRPVVVDLELPDPCAGDLDGDGDVDLADLAILLGAYGVSDAGDLDGDGDTDLADLATLLTDYGTHCD